MAKFKMRLKLTGLEVEIEGERADVPQMAQSVGQQVANLMQPTIAVATSQPTKMIDALPDQKQENEGNKNRTRNRKSSSSREGTSSSESTSKPVDFAHKPDTWGNPLQSWTPVQKIIWLLYVFGQATGTNELPVTSIAPTFKKHFKQAGAIHPPHVTRELGKAKGMVPALVGEDTTKSPPTWYLTDAGRAMGVELVNAARGSGTAPLF